MKENLPKPVPYGNYLLLDRVNVGGMAEVFRAKSTNLEGIERLVAIKRILPHLARDPDFSSMFIDEARIAINLRHANIAQMYELSRVGESLYIAMEYVHGRDLRALINRMRYLRRDIPIPMVVHIISKVCEGLDYAHRKRDDLTMREMEIVHRDVSPQNVIISYEGEIKIIDFGIAKAASKRSHTEAGILKGKFGYMAPEQVAGGDIDRRADVFCTGILMYELLTTDRLFAGSSELSTLRRIRNVEVAPPSMLNRAIPDELEEIVLKALAPLAEDRYPYASDLADDLQRFLHRSHETVFGARQLREFMHEVFSRDIDDDQRTLEGLLKAQPKELPAPSRENDIWEEGPPSHEQLPPSNEAWQEANAGWDAQEQPGSYPDTPSGRDALVTVDISPQEQQHQIVAGYASADFQFDDDDMTRPLKAHPDEDDLTLPPSAMPPVPAAPVAVVASPMATHAPQSAREALGQALPPIHGQEAMVAIPPQHPHTGMGMHPQPGMMPQPPHTGMGMHPGMSHPGMPGVHPQAYGYPPPPPSKPSRAWLWIVSWLLLGGLFLGMVYLLFFFPAPGTPGGTSLFDNLFSNKTPQPGTRRVQPVVDAGNGRRVVPPPPRTRQPDRVVTPRVEPRRNPVETRRPVVPPKAETRWVVLRSRPSRATVYIDGKRRGRTTLKLKLTVRNKAYRLSFRKRGYRSYSRTLRLDSAGGIVTVRTARLSSTRRRPPRTRPPRTRPPRRVPPRPRPAGTKQYGFLTIKGSPIARIYINGLDTGKFLLYKRKLAVGTYKIHFVTSEGDVWETRVTIVAGKVINRVSKYKKK